MTLSDWGLWAAANEMVRQHGDDAAIHVAMRAYELLAEGAYDGANSPKSRVMSLKFNKW